jgi:hypothetical protein
MRHLLVGAVAGALLLGSGVATAAPQDTKSVRGTVSAVGPDSVTVKVKDQDMKFVVDGKTEVIARGGSTKTREAKAQGKSGPPVGSLLKAGQTVQVRYHEAGMHADSVRVVAAGPAKPDSAPAKPAKAASMADEKPTSKTVSGTVSAMTGASLTVKTSAGESTFVIDGKTDIIGTGLGTKSRAAAAAGKKQVLADVIGVGDAVTVHYHEMAGSKNASSVRLTKKALK